MEDTNYCNKCHKEKPLSEFYGADRNICKDCEKDRYKARRARIKADLENPESKYHGTMSGAQMGCKCRRCHEIIAKKRIVERIKRKEAKKRAARHNLRNTRSNSNNQ